MKKLVFILLFLFFVSTAFAVPVITDNYYLNNGKIYDSEAIKVSNILPNTLRIVMTEGEATELYVDILPEKATERELLWSLPENAGRIDIYPRGNACTVLGVEAGEENITVAAPGGASRRIAVKVKEQQEIRTRSFNYEGEGKAETSFTETVMQTVVRVLISLGAAAMLVAVFMFVRNRRTRDNEDEK